MAGVRNSKLSLDFDLSSGIALRSILDVAAGRGYLRAPPMLFEFAANNGTPQQSDTALSVLASEEVDDATLKVAAIAVAEPLTFELLVTLAADSAAKA